MAKTKINYSKKTGKSRMVNNYGVTVVTVITGTEKILNINRMGGKQNILINGGALRNTVTTVTSVTVNYGFYY